MLTCLGNIIIVENISFLMVLIISIYSKVKYNVDNLQTIDNMQFGNSKANRVVSFIYIFVQLNLDMCKQLLVRS